MSDESNGDQVEAREQRQRKMLWQVLVGDVLCGVGFGVLVLTGVRLEIAIASMIVLSVVITTAIVLRFTVMKKR